VCYTNWQVNNNNNTCLLRQNTAANTHTYTIIGLQR